MQKKAKKTAIYDDEVFFQNYLDLRKEENNYNDMIEQPLVFSLLGDVSGKNVLDIGCGYGAMTVKLADSGASHVLGLDVSEKMVAKGKKENARDNIEYRVLPMEKLSTLKEKFHRVVSCLALHYVEDFGKLFRDIADLLEEDGVFVFSMEHPVYTAGWKEPRWEEEDGQLKAFYLDHYGDEGVRKITWLDKEIVKYHHKLETVFNCLFSAGFIMEKVLEPSPTKEMMERVPRTVQELHRPAYLMVRCRKNHE